MATLRADENRYTLTIAPQERPAVARIPGARPSLGGRGWQLPRQAAVILALDRVLTRDNWMPERDLALEVAEARGRRYPPPQAPAHVHLEGGLLSVECTIADKELVKQVPGYRWSPAQKRWYIAAMPLSIEILREAFGDHLSVDREVEELIELKRLDEEREAGTANTPPVPEPVPQPPIHALEAAPAPPDTSPGTAGFRELRRLAPGNGLASDLEPLLERLAVAIEGLTARLDSLGSLANPSRPLNAPIEAVQQEHMEPASGGWRELLARVAVDPLDVLEDARRRIQTSVDPDPELRAVAGIAAWRTGQTDEAFKSLKKALEPGASLEDPDLTATAKRTYEEIVLSLINTDCGPEEPVASVETLRELLRRELSSDQGFADAQVGASRARGTLDLLVNDRALRFVSSELGDCCRILHLLSTARSGTRMASELVADVLRDTGLSADAFALGCILYASVLHDAKSADQWFDRWPGPEDDAPLDDASWLVELAVWRLGAAAPGVGGEASLAVLACIAAGPPDQASLAQRRTLVSYTAPGTSNRRYAEFLAMYRLAATGERLPLDSFNGYVDSLATVSLQRSASYLTEVYFTGEGVPGSPVRAVADDVFLAALELHGITDPDEQLLGLLDLLAAGSHPDNLLNKLGELVETGAFEGAGMLDRDQRIAVYRRALDVSVKMGHNDDAVQAFDRLVREYANDGGPSRLRELCAEFEAGFKPLRIPALTARLESVLDEEAPFEEAVRALTSAMGPNRRGVDVHGALAALQGLQFAYPVLKDALTAEATRDVSEEGTVPSFPQKRVLIVGGREDVRKRAVPVLESWGLDTTWLDPEQAKNGTQATALAEGSCDLVVVNARCIGHAASGRVMTAAERAGNQVWVNQGNGLGTFLFELSVKLRGAEAEGGVRKTRSRLQDLKKIAKR